MSNIIFHCDKICSQKQFIIVVEIHYKNTDFREDVCFPSDVSRLQYECKHVKQISI
jgi:hypothetical protein